MAQENGMDVAAVTPAVSAMRARWDLTDALLMGTEGMREKGETYLKKWPQEDPQDYEYRLSSSYLLSVYEETVSEATDKPFSRPLVLSDDMSETVRGWCDDIDLEGRNLHVFARDVFYDAWGGHSFILVDSPNMAGLRTRADEVAAGVRPYFVHIKAGQVLGWRAERIGGRQVCTQFRYEETTEEDQGDFGVRQKRRVRVITRTNWYLYEAVTNQKTGAISWGQVDTGVNSLGEVPVVPVYTNKTGFFRSVPPFWNLAWMNVAHWNSASDQRNILHVARVPILARIGMDMAGKQEEGAAVGANAGWDIPMGGDIKYVEHSGAAIGAGREDLKDLETQMRQMGAALISEDQSLTRIEAAADSAKSMTRVRAGALNLEDALNLALSYLVRYQPGAGNPGTVTVYKEFDDVTETPVAVGDLSQLAQAEIISRQTAFEEAKRRNVIDPSLTWEEEQKRLSEQGPAPGAAADQTMSEPDPQSVDQAAGAV